MHLKGCFSPTFEAILLQNTLFLKVSPTDQRLLFIGVIFFICDTLSDNFEISVHHCSMLVNSKYSLSLFRHSSFNSIFIIE